MNNINVDTEIIENSRHLFLYGKNNDERHKIFKQAVINHPFKFKEDTPTAIYIDEIGLPNIDTKAKDLDLIRIKRLGMTYLEFCIVHNIIDSIQNTNQENEESCKKLLKSINSISSDIEFKDIDSFKNSLKRSKEFYSKYYSEYLLTGETKLNFENLDILLVPDLGFFIKEIQNTTGNHSFFSIILDRKKKIPLTSVQAINSLINMRSNGYLSIKVVCEPDEWETYRTLNERNIDYMHDYSTVDLDNSEKEYIEKIKKRYNFGRDDDRDER